MNGKHFKRRIPVTRSLVIAVGAPAIALSLTGLSYAAELIKPQIGEPLRDAAVTRSPDGTYYLTGGRTTGQYNGNPDFLNNDGIKLWSSKDLVTWKDAGFALDLKNRSGWTNDPLLQFYFLPERAPDLEIHRGLRARRDRNHEAGETGVEESLKSKGLTRDEIMRGVKEADIPHEQMKPLRRAMDYPGLRLTENSLPESATPCCSAISSTAGGATTAASLWTCLWTP